MCVCMFRGSTYLQPIKRIKLRELYVQYLQAIFIDEIVPQFFSRFSELGVPLEHNEVTLPLSEYAVIPTSPVFVLMAGHAVCVSVHVSPSQ